MNDERRYELLKMFLRPTEDDGETTSQKQFEELKDDIITLSHEGYVEIDYIDGEIDSWEVTDEGKKFVNEHGK